MLILWHELICNATLNDCGGPSLMVLLHPVAFLFILPFWCVFVCTLKRQRIHYIPRRASPAWCDACSLSAPLFFSEIRDYGFRTLNSCQLSRQIIPCVIEQSLKYLWWHMIQFPNMNFKVTQPFLLHSLSALLWLVYSGENINFHSVFY